MAIDTKSFIYDARLKGMTDNAIRTALLNMGVPAAEVNTHFPAFVMQSQPEQQVAKTEEVQPKAAAPQEVKPQAVMREQVQPKAAAPQEVQPQTVSPQQAKPEPQKIVMQQAQPEIAPLPKGLPTIDSVASNKPVSSAMSTTSIGGPQGIKETVMQSVGTFAAQPANTPSGTPATNTVFGNQPAATAQTSEPQPKSKKPLVAIIVTVLILGVAGAGYLFFIKNKAIAPSLPVEVQTATTTSVQAVPLEITQMTFASSTLTYPFSNASLKIVLRNNSAQTIENYFYRFYLDENDTFGQVAGNNLLTLNPGATFEISSADAADAIKELASSCDAFGLGAGQYHLHLKVSTDTTKPLNSDTTGPSVSDSLAPFTLTAPCQKKSPATGTPQAGQSPKDAYLAAKTAENNLKTLADIEAFALKYSDKAAVAEFYTQKPQLASASPEEIATLIAFISQPSVSQITLITTAISGKTATLTAKANSPTYKAGTIIMMLEGGQWKLDNEDWSK